MITQFFLPKLDDVDMANIVSTKRANETIQLLHQTFSGRTLLF